MTSRKRENFVLIITDEERFPVPEENELFEEFRKTYMKGHQFFKDNATELKNHIINSSACRSSRGNIFTGHPINTTRVKNTNGLAKDDDDKDLMFDLFGPVKDSKEWFPSNYLPTMGHYFRSIGYQTYYSGKWHISNEDLEHKEEFNSHSDKHPSHTVCKDGKRVDKNYQMYKEKNLLDKFGFKGWIGDEPHGPFSRKSGVYVDPHYTDQAIDILNYVDSDENPDKDKPYLLVISYVNPHDYVLWSRRIVQTRLREGFGGMLGSNFRKQLAEKISEDGKSDKNSGDRKFDETLIPDLSHVPVLDKYVSESEIISTKPTVQADYRSTYKKMVSSSALYWLFNLNKEDQVKYYYHVMHLVSKEIQKFLNIAFCHKRHKDTYYVLTTDHGDLVGAHKGLQQKWHCVYDEVIHVPMFIFHPVKLNKKRTIDELTCHLDLIPTFIGLATKDMTTKETEDANQAIRDMKDKFVCQNELNGIDLTNLIFDKGGDDPILDKVFQDEFRNRWVYFNTEDQVSKGSNQTSIASRLLPWTKYVFRYKYESIKGADCIEAVISKIVLDRDFVKTYVERYNKYFKFYGKKHQEKLKIISNRINSGHNFELTSIVKVARYYDKDNKSADEWEMYILELDPAEIINLTRNGSTLSHEEYAVFLGMYGKLIKSSYNKITLPYFNKKIKQKYNVRRSKL